MSDTHEPISYADAGVDIAAQDEALARARDAIRATNTAGVLGDVGLFGGLFDPAAMGFSDAILVASADGVGTKLEIAKRAERYDGVGRDLVQHCINDILAQGARPLFFLDYVGTGELEPSVVAGLIQGCAAACRDHGVALLGGETAEMPGLYSKGDFDLVGFVVGAVKREHLIDGTRVRPGQTLIGLASDGLHTNGYSLARKVCFEALGLGLHDTPPELGGTTVVDALLAPHRCYLSSLLPLIERGDVAAWAHITGGGVPGNLNRILTTQDAVVRCDAWERPGLFKLLTRDGIVEESEAWRAFNMGVGAILAVEPERVDAILANLAAAGETAFVCGELVEGDGQVHLRP
ncbi:Phosphoribosylformylglycinamidine cyclo-ligase [Planctomycetes bacterium Pla163]|uniref:Phosphoribosylformylglycinamidine cyclo-ligase n=1 Tax=Rohdeia mirabilis TaxID=2528008 RepID=A0A518D0I3_9BACT|nr:Phosphoribosylformylglycinamidine cyclo-ligase [Planctomycetes bacterium Pla163]